MVNELLDFHRVEVKSAQLRTTYTSIPEYVSDIYEEFKGWAEASDIHVNLQIDNPEIGMWIDPEHFGKILSNILSNSIRYSHAGSEINIQVAKGYVNDIVPRYKDSFWNTKDMIPGEQAIIRVSDTGIGMEKAVLPTIFKRFHQVQNNTGKQHTGSGIGLSLVKSLIELHQQQAGCRNRSYHSPADIGHLSGQRGKDRRKYFRTKRLFIKLCSRVRTIGDRRNHSYLYGRQTYDSAGG